MDQQTSKIWDTEIIGNNERARPPKFWTDVIKEGLKSWKIPFYLSQDHDGLREHLHFSMTKPN